MPIAIPASCAQPPLHHAKDSSQKKKEGGRVRVLAVAAAGRSILTRFVLARVLVSGGVACVRLTGRGCYAAQLSFPVQLDCLPQSDGTLLCLQHKPGPCPGDDTFTPTHDV
jgi:hypothetical protein